MRVTLNGEPAQFTEMTTVAELVERLGNRRGVAVAVNEEVVPRSAWTATPMREGDRVELLTPAQGG